MQQHYTIIIPAKSEFERDYVDGIMAESLGDAVEKFNDCLDLEEYTKLQIASFITQI